MSAPDPNIDVEAMENREIHLASQAKQVLENAAFQDAVQTLKDRYRDTWERSAVADIEGRELAYRAIAALDDILVQLRTVLTTGKMAEKAREIREHQQAQEARIRGNGRAGGNTDVPPR